MLAPPRWMLFRRQSIRPQPWRLPRAVGVAGFSLLALGGAVIFVRRLSGALAAPLSFGTLLACACLFAAGALLFRAAFQPPEWSRQRWGEILYCALPSGVLLLWAIGLSAPGTTGGLVALWGVLLSEEGWSWGQLGRRRHISPPSVAKTSNVAELPASAVMEPGEFLGQPESLADVDEPDRAICQQIVRRRESDGSETIAGWLRAEVPAGERDMRRRTWRFVRPSKVCPSVSPSRWTARPRRSRWPRCCRTARDSKSSSTSRAPSRRTCWSNSQFGMAAPIRRESIESSGWHWHLASANSTPTRRASEGSSLRALARASR